MKITLYGLMTTALSGNVEYSFILTNEDTFIWTVEDSFIWTDKERFTCNLENAFICTDEDSFIPWVQLSRILSPVWSEDGNLSLRNFLKIEKIHFNEMINQAQLECHNINYQILCFVVQCEFQRRGGEDNIVIMYYRRNLSFVFWEFSTASVFKIHCFSNVVTLVF